MSEVKPPVTAEVRAPDSFLNKLKRVVTSACLFLLTFYIVHISYSLVTALFCWMLGYSPVIFFNGVTGLPVDYHDWSTMRVLFLYSLGPLWTVLLGLSLLRVYNKQKEKGMEKLFVLWLILNAITYFLFLIIISPFGIENFGTAFYRGWAVIATWLRISPIIMAFFAILAVAGCVFYGYYTSYEYLKYSYSSRLIQTGGGKNKVTLQYFIYPVLLGSVGILIFSGRSSWLTYLTYTVCMLAVGVGMLIKNSNDITTVKCTKADVLNRVPYFYLSAVAISIALIQWLLIPKRW